MYLVPLIPERDTLLGKMKTKESYEVELAGETADCRRENKRQ